MEAVTVRVVTLIKYGVGIMHRTKSDKPKLYRKTRMLFTRHDAYQPKSDINRLHMKR